MAGNQSKSTSAGLDSLLEAMPKIAEAVKAFPEALQSQAFDALMQELKSTSPVSSSSKPKTPRKTSAKETSAPTTKRSRRRGPTTIKDLDLQPEGKESLSAFVDRKKPKTNYARNVVSVYYLTEVLGVTSVSINHVFTCYKDMGWREPTDLANSLAQTASHKRHLDTADLDDIKLTPAGRNHVQHDLPPDVKS